MIKKNYFKQFLFSTALVFFYSCDADKDIVTNSSAVEKTYILKSEKIISDDLQVRLNAFAEEYVILNNQIRLLLEDEKNANFDNLQMDDLKNSRNEEELKTALEKAGVVKYEELGNLIMDLGQNGHEFYSNNEEFDSLQEETQHSVVLDAVDNALIGNPIKWTPEDPGESPLARTCYEQYTVDKNRCNRNVVRNGTIATFAFLGGPLLGGVAYFAVAWEANDCLTDARVDYNDCLSS